MALSAEGLHLPLSSLTGPCWPGRSCRVCRRTAHGQPPGSVTGTMLNHALFLGGEVWKLGLCGGFVSAVVRGLLWAWLGGRSGLPCRIPVGKLGRRLAVSEALRPVCVAAPCSPDGLFPSCQAAVVNEAAVTAPCWAKVDGQLPL